MDAEVNQFAQSSILISLLMAAFVEIAVHKTKPLPI